ncbi:uncharacterized protein IUM83_16344 [Phytophthora cinnamomi]|uniref:uncharacterized protein n=1 Tax=Phytophthora cinnamomi TaxID=4785 RepID=UPI00355A88EC|nr:hypothetical protein IUM83_16344 [Phytophthora cinnamomi]
MFGIETDSDSDDSELADVMPAFDEVDEDNASAGDDPDYEEKAPYPLGTAGSADVDDEVENDTERDEEDEVECEGDEVSEVRRSSSFTSTSVPLSNKQIIRMAKARKKAGKRARKAHPKAIVCTHWQPYEPNDKGKRIHDKVRDTKCKAGVNIRVTAKLSGSWYLRVNATGNHNHNLNKHIWDNYAEKRTVKAPQLTGDVAVLHKAGANTQGIRQYLRKHKKTTRRVVHNMVQRYKLDEQAGLTDAQHAFVVMEAFCRQDGGNSAQVLVNSDTNIARMATFQARMKHLFKAFPEVILVNSTHDTNVNR